MALISIIAAVVSVITGGITLVISKWLWLRYCRYVHDQAVARGQNPNPVQMIREAGDGFSDRSARSPALRSPPKTDDTSLAA